MVRLYAYLETSGLVFDVQGLRRFFLAIQSGHDAYVTKPLKPASLKHAHTILTAFANWCIEEGLLTENPMKRVPAAVFVPERIEPFSGGEVARILAAAGRSLNPHRDLAVICLLTDTGLRASELCSVKVEDVDLKTRTIRVIAGKGGKSREVAYGSGTGEALGQYMDHQSLEPCDWLFLSERGGQLTRQALLKTCTRLGDAAGVRNVHPHRFRHNCALSLLRGGGHILGIMAQLGHSKVQTTSIYVRIAEQDVRAMLELASPADALNRMQP